MYYCQCRTARMNNEAWPRGLIRVNIGNLGKQGAGFVQAKATQLWRRTWCFRDRGHGRSGLTELVTATIQICAEQRDYRSRHCEFVGSLYGWGCALSSLTGAGGHPLAHGLRCTFTDLYHTIPHHLPQQLHRLPPCGLTAAAFILIVVTRLG